MRLGADPTALLSKAEFLVKWWRYHEDGGHSTTIWDAERAYKRYVEGKEEYSFLENVCV